MISNLLPLIIFLVSGGYAGYIKNKYKSDIANINSLTNTEKLIVIITEIFVPVIAGAIYYYSWKKVCPVKAKQANKYSMIIFLIELMGAFVLLTLFPELFTSDI